MAHAQSQNAVVCRAQLPSSPGSLLKAANVLGIRGWLCSMDSQLTTPRRVGILTDADKVRLAVGGLARGRLGDPQLLKAMSQKIQQGHGRPFKERVRLENKVAAFQNFYESRGGK